MYSQTMNATAETARDVIDRIRRNERERDYCLAVLDLWAQVQEQGIEIGRVASFGFDSRVLTEKRSATSTGGWKTTSRPCLPARSGPACTTMSGTTTAA